MLMVVACPFMAIQYSGVPPPPTVVAIALNAQNEYPPCTSDCDVSGAIVMVMAYSVALTLLPRQTRIENVVDDLPLAAAVAPDHDVLAAVLERLGQLVVPALDRQLAAGDHVVGHEIDVRRPRREHSAPEPADVHPPVQR